MNRTTLVYGLGAIGLGLLGLRYFDFALQWQPVPRDLPHREAIAAMSALLLLLAGIAALTQRAWAIGLLLLAALYGSWALLLHAPRVAAAPLDLSKWQGLAEITALASAAVIGLAAERGAQRLARMAQIVFGACCLVFGASHFVYAKFTASFVPPWLPEPLYWAYATGAAHVAAGLSLISGVLARWGAIGAAAMYAGFVLLLHVPRVFHAPGERIEWTMLAVAASLTGAAWIVGSSIRPGARR